ncbi:MAG: SDR family NAD(P)-dependent oxidoreductase [Clostridia bacterium]|nr:SDR family NAD(P)-dependent oxidoreductase [Clostridia bacterium]
MKWLDANTESLSGKTVAITGSTGGLGKELCAYLAHLGASLVLVDRSEIRSKAHAEDIVREFPSVSVLRVRADLSDIESVKRATEELRELPIDYFIHNAGAYSIPRSITSSGYDNVYTINFISPYYMIRELMPHLKARGGKAVVVGSIAHNYSRVDECDVDFRGRKRASLVYGNAKRYLTYSLLEYYKEEALAPITVTHPGITFTNITSHYPPLIFFIIKYPMKIIFMKPRIACLSVLKGLFSSTTDKEWIGPSLFDVWGMPKLKPLLTADDAERSFISKTAEKIYSDIKNIR